MAQAETEELTRVILGVALSRAVCTIAELGLADQIEAGSPRSVASLARATATHEPSLYRILRFLASHGIFQEKVIPNNGRLLVIESVVPTGDEPSLAKDFDMAMLTLPGGIERTEAEYRFLFAQAGFQLSSVTPTPSTVSVIEGKPR